MKKQNFLFSVLMALCAMTVSTLFTSCGGDDTPQQAPEAPITATLYCHLLTNDETLANIDFYLTYYDANGQIKSEKVVWDAELDESGRRTYTQIVTANVPATLGVHCEIKLKDGLDPEAKYNVAFGQCCVPTTSKVNNGGYSLISDYSVSEGVRGDFYKIFNESALNVIYHFDSKGNYSTSKWQ